MNVTASLAILNGPRDVCEATKNFSAALNESGIRIPLELGRIKETHHSNHKQGRNPIAVSVKGSRGETMDRSSVNQSPSLLVVPKPAVQS